MVESKASISWVIAACLVVIAGCNGGGGREGSLYARLQDDSPQVRLEAAMQAADRGDQQAVPLIVEQLGSGDSDVRLVAGESLRRLTGLTLGYRHYAPVDQRRQAMLRWRQWLAAGRPRTDDSQWQWPATASAPAESGSASRP